MLESLCITSKADPFVVDFRSTQVVHGFVNHGKTDDGVDHVGTDADVRQHPEEQGDRVADGEQGDVEAHVFQAVEKEDHPKEEQQVVVAGDHVLGAHVHKRYQHHPGAFLNETLVSLGDTVGERFGHADKEQRCE